MSPTEVARQVEIADTLCAMSDEVLAAIWDQLDDDQLTYQDFVFGSHCPDRSIAYGLATGRALTPEARLAAAEQQTDYQTSSTIVLPVPTQPTLNTPGGAIAESPTPTTLAE